MAKSGSVELREELYRYMKEHGGLIWPDEAARELGVPVIDVLAALRRLEGKGKAREVRPVSWGQNPLPRTQSH